MHTSTSEVYGTARTVPITEDHPLEPQSPYAASKIGADQLMDSFHRSFDLPVTVLRPFNTYGPRQSARAVIPTIISQALAGRHVQLGSLDPRRDLTFVADTVAGFVAAAVGDGGGRAARCSSAPAATSRSAISSTLVGECSARELAVEQDPERVRPPNSEVERLISSPARARGADRLEPRSTCARASSARSRGSSATGPLSRRRVRGMSATEVEHFYEDFSFDAGLRDWQRPNARHERMRLELDDMLGGARGLRMLDIGCGGGVLSSFLCRYGEVTGIDLSRSATELAGLLEPGPSSMPGPSRNTRATAATTW